MISIQSIIDNHIKAEFEKRERLKEVSLSQIGKCIRQLILNYKGYEPIPFNERQLRIFAVGYIFEKFILDILEKEGYLLKRQEPTEYKGIKGTCDGILLDKEASENILFDVKTVHSRKFQYLDNGEVDEMYHYQLMSYYSGLSTVLKLSATPRIFYVSKDDLLLKEIGVATTSDWKDKIDKKIDDIKHWQKQDKLPNEKDEPTWECFSVSQKFKEVKVWCRFLKHCPNISKCYEEAVKKMGKKS
jgi:hypothetical protein